MPQAENRCGRVGTVMQLCDRVFNLLFPPKCPFCGRVTDGPGVCAGCESSLPWTAEHHSLWELPGGLRCVAPLWYKDAVRKGLARFKFQGAAGAANALGALVAQCAAERLSGEFDVVTWAPVSRKRLKRRGYDQAELLACGACRLWSTRPERLLCKIVDNPPQSGLEDAAARSKNVSGVYVPAEGAEIQGRRILLVDDICTTGATLASCAGALRAAGAAAVVCAAVARTPLEKKVYNLKEE